MGGRKSPLENVVNPCEGEALFEKGYRCKHEALLACWNLRAKIASRLTDRMREAWYIGQRQATYANHEFLVCPAFDFHWHLGCKAF